MNEENISFDQPQPKAGINKVLVGGIFVAVVFGAATGFIINKVVNKESGLTGTGSVNQATGESGQSVKVGESYGSKDNIFKDSATGVIEADKEGGVGTHKLLREGGESQTARLTSSVVDLDMFVGRKVEVWGETFDSDEAGWFLDVGRVKVLE
jgi:hypothetical protein